MIINKIQESCIHLFLINYLVIHYKKIMPLKTFNSEFSYINYGLQIKIANH